MRSTTCPLPTCSNGSRPRCRVPLIELCGAPGRLKLDLASCGPCAAAPAALLLTKAGCPEYETVCVEPEPRPCCGAVDARPAGLGSRRQVEKPRPRLIYPLLEIDADGMSVFVLDDKLAKAGYGRWRAEVLLGGEAGEDGKPKFEKSGVMFDIDFYDKATSLGGIEVEYATRALGDGPCS